MKVLVMIKFDDKPPAPAVLSRPKIKAALTYLESQLIKNGSLSSKDFIGKNYWSEVKKDLRRFQHGKCCFCERGRDANRESDVEHFRPKLARDNEPAPNHNGYWWLAYKWENLFFVCSECNSIFKKNFFPLINPEDRAFNKDSDLSKERPYLLNPALDDPEQFIIYDYTNPKVPVPVSSANDNDDRGKKTIELLGLNKRTTLITDRAEKLKNMELCAKAIIYFQMSDKDFTDQLKKQIGSLKSHTNSKSNYAGFSRFFYNQMGLVEHIDNN
jgi:uncharacterized protein (TIGR02646 family)